MGNLRQSLRRIPFWAYLLVILAIAVNTIYLFYKGKISDDGFGYESINGNWVVVANYDPTGAGYIAGIRPGDLVISIDSIPIQKYLDGSYSVHAGDSVSYQIIRDQRVFQIRFIADAVFSHVSVFFWILYFFMFLFSLTSLYILVKKPDDIAVKLFFIYLQLLSVTMNAWGIPFQDMPAVIANMVFTFNDFMLGPVLIQFHMLFPKPMKLIIRFPGFPLLVYITGIAALILFTFFPAVVPVERIDLKWLTFTFIIAIATAIYRYLTIRDSMMRNQLLIIITGSFFGLIMPVLYTFFFDYVNQMGNFLYTVMIPHGIGSMIMICCILIAIFNYRIWDIEVVIRKALLYLGATAVIILTYLFLIWLVDQFTAGAADIIRFTALAASVILFLALRDRIQRLIDRLFHRETYDSATVISDFEAKLAGIYRFEELKQKIAEGLEQIFHFKSFVFSLKKSGLYYEPAFIIGNVNPKAGTDYAISRDMEEKLQKSKVFSPEELNQKPPFLEAIKGDLIVPMVSGGQPEGFFICGQKKSERIYSRQDINVLSLLARRVITLLYTASLYQKDMDRQLMLERERARISQDMHDDIGAGLTKIAMISEAPTIVHSPQSTVCNFQSTVFNQQSLIADCRLSTADLIQDRLNRIASTSREMITRLNVIVWALNPKYDNLGSLVSYLKRYFGEYLENFNIRFTTDLPDQIPDISITPDTRRNIFYAVQEAIHNAVKHSGCSEISLSFEYSPHLHGEGVRGVRFTITDNGKGFEQVNPGSGGNGLVNMRKRTEELGGSFDINSCQGKGVNVTFKMNL